MDNTEFWACYADIDGDGDGDGEVGLGDLATLLANYGRSSGATRGDGDLDFDGDVDLSDLATLLGVYGEDCNCHRGGGGGGRDGDASSYIDVDVVAYDTSGYTGGGFRGEVDHFIHDIKVEILDPNDDDWTITGALVEADNDATFRLSTGVTTPNAYATFVAAPWTTLPGGSTATVAGDYDPADTSYTFTTTEVNVAWFDLAESNDGPGVVLRLVIDVSEVDGADVSTGFGSVYFSQSGPTGKTDILVAELTSETASALSEGDLLALSGNFYVKGE
jgi:hypothetical protein